MFARGFAGWRSRAAAWQRCLLHAYFAQNSRASRWRKLQQLNLLDQLRQQSPRLVRDLLD